MKSEKVRITAEEKRVQFESNLDRLTQVVINKIFADLSDPSERLPYSYNSFIGNMVMKSKKHKQQVLDVLKEHGFKVKIAWLSNTIIIS
jgi:hypothetical protein